jgi:hypothetical protein
MIVISSPNESKMESRAADVPRLSESKSKQIAKPSISTGRTASKAHTLTQANKRSATMVATLTEPHDRHGSDGLHACVDSQA